MSTTRGQSNKRAIMWEMCNILPTITPATKEKIVATLSFILNLTPDTVKYNYLNVLEELGIMYMNNRLYHFRNPEEVGFTIAYVEPRHELKERERENELEHKPISDIVKEATGVEITDKNNAKDSKA